MSKYFVKLESLRGVAAFALVLYHSPFYQNGNPNSFVANSDLFVDFFFILSGFVMMYAYGDRIRDGFRFRNYFFLRLGRIYPLHLALLLAWAFYVFGKWMLFSRQIETVNPFLKNTGESFLTNLFLVHSLNLHSYLSWNYPSWSISVEFFTYFVFFGFCLLTRKFRNPLAALAVSLCAYFYVLNQTDWQTLDLTTVNGIFRCAGGFFAGVFLFQMTDQERKLGSGLTALLEFVAVGLVVLTVSFSAENSLFLILVIPAMVLAVCVFSLESDGLIGRALKLRPFALAGKYSYSIYLIHALVLETVFSLTKYLLVKPGENIYYLQFSSAFIVNIGLMILVFLLAAATYHLIEERWLKKSRNFVARLDDFDRIDEKKAVYV
jgi:peptidoglycan/LPS O-acetylase OafA/YrhL